MKFFIYCILLLSLLGCVSKETSCLIVKTGVNLGLPLALDNHILNMKDINSQKYIKITSNILRENIIPKLKNKNSHIKIEQINEFLKILQKDMSFGEKLALQTGINFIFQTQIKGKNKSWSDILYVSVCFFEGILKVFESYNFSKDKIKAIIIPIRKDKRFIVRWKQLENIYPLKK